MRKSPLPAALFLMTFAACAPNVFRADVGAMFVEADGEVALQNGAGTLVLHNEQNRVDKDLNLGDTEAAPYLRLEWERDAHRVRAHGFGIKSSASGTLAGDFGGIAAGSIVNTSMRFFNATAGYSYAIFGDADYRIGVGGQLGYYMLNIRARAGGPAFEEVESNVLVPMPFAEAEYRFGPVTLAANAGVMSADLGDANGRYWDVEAMARWQITHEVDVLAGYRYLLLDGFGAASGRDFDADVDFDGWFIGGGIRF